MLRHQAVGEAGAGFVGSAARSVARDGRNPVERKAVARVQREIAAMPASLVVQLALWPDEIAAWARAEGSSESLVYNMLARRKPYLRVRERLAERLEVSAAVLAHLVDARRPLPLAKRDPAAGVAGEVESTGEPVDWKHPPFPQQRDGSNPIERRAVRVVEREIASMPASAVVGLALWPTTLADWSREQRLKSSLVWATLAGSPSERVRADLARRLDVTRRDLDDLVAAVRAQPGAERTEVLADRGVDGRGVADREAPVQDIVAALATSSRRPARATIHIAGELPPDEPPEQRQAAPPRDRDQLSLGL